MKKELTNSTVFHPAVTYAASQHQERLFWITYKRLKLQRKAGRLQLIQNSTPSVAGMRQCCIQIGVDNEKALKLDNRIQPDFNKEISPKNATKHPVA